MFTREMLKALGLDDETIEKIMSSYGQAVGEINRSNEALTAEVTELKEQAATNATALADLKKDADAVPGLKEKIEKMESDQSEAIKASEAKIAETKKGYEVQLALAAFKARNVKAVKALLDLDAVTLDANGKLLGLGEQLESLKNDEETSFLFAEDEGETQDLKKRKISFDGNSNGNLDNSTGDAFDKRMEKYK